ncbi:RNase H domain-containing protein [Trichonephila clavipes]|uniref:RNase H domain-containing protein n=1 Tax=Trichonephila clavipes TaxID=2585209 RepID=A0A8X6WAX9_TRICX|nr:RNase H domain-containing protein [Trichonephila clavipes]
MGILISDASYECLLEILDGNKHRQDRPLGQDIVTSDAIPQHQRSRQINLQWILFHVDLEGNEITDTLAKAGACDFPEPSAPLAFLEIFSRTKHQNKTAWIFPPEHHWYQCSRPGGSLSHGFKRRDQTLLAHFRSGHLKTMKFLEGFKSLEICTNCSSEPASPAHIIECLG